VRTAIVDKLFNHKTGKAKLRRFWRRTSGSTHDEHREHEPDDEGGDSARGGDAPELAGFGEAPGGAIGRGGGGGEHEQGGAEQAALCEAGFERGREAVRLAPRELALEPTNGRFVTRRGIVEWAVCSSFSSCQPSPCTNAHCRAASRLFSRGAIQRAECAEVARILQVHSVRKPREEAVHPDQ